MKERPFLQSSGAIDPMLDNLCGKLKWISPTSLADYGLNRRSYRIDVEFPHLGKRFIDLQRYSEAQTPNRLAELWTDRRNSLQWFTFWAVIVFGGISIFLSLVQIAISSAQLYYTIPGNN